VPAASGRLDRRRAPRQGDPQRRPSTSRQRAPPPAEDGRSRRQSIVGWGRYNGFSREGAAMRGPYGIVGLVVTIIVIIVILRLLGVV
jgi:hypothetical protein